MSVVFRPNVLDVCHTQNMSLQDVTLSLCLLVYMIWSLVSLVVPPSLVSPNCDDWLDLALTQPSPGRPARAHQQRPEA